MLNIKRGERILSQDYRYEQIWNIYSNLESEMLYDLIKTCKNKALIFPTVVAHQFARKLQNETLLKNRDGQERKVDVGVEQYFNFHGVAAPFLMQRVKARQMSGIFEWHESVVWLVLVYCIRYTVAKA